MDARYMTSAARSSQLPRTNEGEYAFIGRSNCGKSTLINALVGQKNLARSSRVPGRTVMANFFKVNDRTMFVDLPGYGFSKSGKLTRIHWLDLMEAYVERKNIKEFLFLFDARRDFKDEDFELLEFLEKKSPVVVVLTKIDKLNKTELKNRRQYFKNTLKNDLEFVSSLNKAGLSDLRDRLLN